LQRTEGGLTGEEEEEEEEGRKKPQEFSLSLVTMDGWMGCCSGLEISLGKWKRGGERE
jgi:hypothetical protein